MGKILTEEGKEGFTANQVQRSRSDVIEGGKMPKGALIDPRHLGISKTKETKRRPQIHRGAISRQFRGEKAVGRGS